MPRIREIFLVFLCLAPSPALALTTLPSVNVMADSSLSLAMDEIARSYSRTHNIIVNTSFAVPDVQDAQIAEGAAADVLITPDAAWINRLKEKGLIDVHSPVVIARGHLALAGPPGTPVAAEEKHFPLNGILNQMHGQPDFVVANPASLPEGSYSREALKNLGVSDDLEPDTLYLKQRSEMLDMVEFHGAYGVFYYSTLLANPDLRVLYVLPDKTHKPINYTAVVIAGNNMDEARDFLAYLHTDEARRAFERHGLTAQ